MKHEIIFEETQGKGSAATFLKLLDAFLIISLIVNYYRGANETLFYVLVISVLLCSIAIFFSGIKMVTQIRTDGIYIRFSPFRPSFEKFPWEKIKDIYVREYDGQSEYWGWGIKTGPSGRSITTSGNVGIQIIFQDDSRLLIGTNQPAKIKEALEQSTKSVN